MFADCYVEYVIFDFYILKGLYVIVDGLAAHLPHLRLRKLYNLKMDGLAAHLLLLRLRGAYAARSALVKSEAPLQPLEKEIPSARPSFSHKKTICANPDH